MNRKIIFILSFLFLTIGAFAQDATDFARSAEAKYKAQEYPEAIDLYTQAIAIDSSQKNFFTRRGFFYTLMKDFKAAKADYSQVIKMDDQDKFAYLSRGGALNKLEDYNTAIKDFNKVIILDPKNWEAYNNRGIAKKMLGDQEGACKDWKMSKKLGNPEAKRILDNNYCK